MNEHNRVIKFSDGRAQHRAPVLRTLSLSLLSLLLLGEIPVAATVKSWVHGAANNNFSANSNWSPSGSPATVAPGDDLLFGTDNSIKPNMNDVAGTSTNYSSLTFSNGGFTIRTAIDGRLMRIKAGGGITNQSGFNNGDNQIGPHVVMLGAMTVVNDNVNSKLIFIPDDRNADKYTIDGGNNALTFDGAGSFTIGSVAPNVGEMRNIGSLIKKGAGFLELWGTNQWNGNCDVQAGTFRLSTVNQLHGLVSVASGATFVATIDHAGATLSLPGLTLGNSGSSVTTNTFEVGAFGLPVVSVVSVSNLTVNGTVQVNVTASGLRPGQFTLIKYQAMGGSGGNFVSNHFPPGVTGFISNNIANKSIDMVIVGPVVPAQADQFVDLLSVNVHINFSDNPFFAVYVYSNTLPAVKALGLRHIRDGFGDWNNDLGSNGIHLQVAIGGCSNSQIPGVVADLLAAANRLNPGILDWIEGVNEPDIFDAYMSAQDVFDLQKALWTAFKSDTNQSHVAILMPPLTTGGSGVGYNGGPELARQLAALGIQQYADFANAHPYPDSWHMPEGSAKISDHLAVSQTDAPGLPVIVSETQYCTPPNEHGVDEWAAGIYTPRLLLELNERGIKHTSLYELFDLPEEGGNFSFAGLYHSDGTTPGTIKPQGLSIKNLIALLADPGPSFSVSNLDFTVSGGALKTKLFQKRNGEYWLALWRPVEVGYWNGTVFVDSYPAAENSTLTFHGGFVPSGITTYADLSSPTMTITNLVPSGSVTIPDVGGMVKFVKITGAITIPVTTIIYPPWFNENGQPVLAGTNSTATAGGSYSILSSTNLASPLSAWATNISGVFGVGGSFSNAIVRDPSDGPRFFIIKTP